MRRTLLVMATVATMTMPSAGLSPTLAQQAQYEGPWCATVFNGEGSVKEICHFRDFESCRLEVVGGNRGTCGHNPRYAGKIDAYGTASGQSGPSAKRISKRKHHRHPG
jgi:hypothetical protein